MNIQLGSLVKIAVPLIAGDAPELQGIVIEMMPMQTEINKGKQLCKVMLNDGGEEYCMLTDLKLVK
jgi:hypothetical protein